MTDRELCSLVGNSGRPTDRPAEGFPSDFFQRLYSILSFLGSFPNDSFGFSTHVSSPINSETVEKSTNKISTSFEKFEKDLVKF